MDYIELAQRERYFPAFMAASNVSSIDMRVQRVADGYWWDFNGGGSWKANQAACTTPEQALAKNEDNIWLWTTGWRVPFAEYTQYQVVFETNQGVVYPGPVIVPTRMIDGVAETGTLSTEEMTSDFDLIEVTTDHFVNRVMLWLTGALAGQVAAISAYTGTAGKFGYATRTDAPSNGDNFRVL